MQITLNYLFINLMLDVNALHLEFFVVLLNMSSGIIWLYKWEEK